jgi:hypothetical protein
MGQKIVAWSIEIREGVLSCDIGLEGCMQLYSAKAKLIKV